MVTPSTHEITDLLQAWSRGDDQALEKLTPLVYEELHRAAKLCMSRERRGHTLQTTVLINELYLRMIDLRQVSWQDRPHFFAVCARPDAAHSHGSVSRAAVSEAGRRSAVNLARSSSGGLPTSTP